MEETSGGLLRALRSLGRCSDFCCLSGLPALQINKSARVCAVPQSKIDPNMVCRDPCYSGNKPCTHLFPIDSQSSDRQPRRRAWTRAKSSAGCWEKPITSFCSLAFFLGGGWASWDPLCWNCLGMLGLAKETFPTRKTTGEITPLGWESAM